MDAGERSGSPGGWFAEHAADRGRPVVSDALGGGVRLFSYGATTYGSPDPGPSARESATAHGTEHRAEPISTPVFDALYAERYEPR